MASRSRRGVLLLLVLALLAMFAMLAVAFVVLTGSAKRNADRVRTIDTVFESPAKTLQQGANVVFRGSYVDLTGATLPTSAITWQSLLEKIYGDGTIGTLTAPATLQNVSPVCGGQLIEFTLPAGTDAFHWVGCVVTMLTGSDAGLSTRIVGINPTTFNPQMVAFDGGVLPAAGDQYIVNGFPYGGMGFGFNSATGGLTQVPPGGTLPLALLPNAPPSAWGLTNGVMPGGVNSDHTSADYQDPLLALAVPNGSGGISVPIPSLHRSDLIAHLNAANNIMNNATILRQVMFRPNSIDHPNFTGSNPSFNPLWDGITPGGGQWDVDNDGDGVPDSVWVDLGLPVRCTVDGQAYKPLFAILCLDMDGRLNLNAHGSYAQTQPAYYQQMMGPPMSLQPYVPLSSPPGSAAILDVGIGTTPAALAYFASTFGASLAVPPIALPRGQGTGTAEVNLLPLFRNLATPTSFYGGYPTLLTGSGGYMGRYGPSVGSALPGINGTGSVLTLNNAFPYNGAIGGNYWTNFQATYDAFGSPPDPQTMGAVALDRAGRPLYISLGGQVANGPYDIDLTRNAAHAVDQATTPDNAFSVAEVERILRCYDRDATTLPPRLFALTNSGSGSILQSRRAEFTSESWNVPCASAVLPPALRASLPNNRSLHPVDILQAAFAKNGGTFSLALRTQLLPWEILQGLKMDLNRPFGAGAQSTNTNGVLIPLLGGSKSLPDQPGTSGEQLQQTTTAAGASVAALFNYSADAGAVSQVNGAAVNDSLSARQLYARHLYVLMMALADTSAILADLQKTSAAATSDDVTRLIAQWAVNVVAYRDHNSIMIPFPYDPNPFGGTGWNPPNTPQYTVWGCKRPELLITETLAFHDRRTQDLANEVVDPKKLAADGAAYARTGPGLTTSPQPNQDPGFNSAFRPQGSLFVELYNPWTILEPRTTDLGPNPAAGLNGVQLNKITPAVNGKSSPIWRLVIVDPSLNPPPTLPPPTNGDELPDPDNPIVTSRPVIERAAYFVNLTGLTTPGDGQVSYSLSPANPANGVPLVVPASGYAVVGSSNIGAAPANPDLNRTYIGFETGQTAGNPATTRMVTMNQADLTDARVVRNTADPLPSANPPKVLGIDFPQRLSVSEPTVGYVPYEIDGVGTQAVYIAATGQYNETLDIPVDQQRFLISNERFAGTSIWQWLNSNATIPAFRIIYLQRLADPTRPFVADTSGGNPQQWNPYRTVDAMTVDLTTFNGLANPDPPIDPAVVGTYHFEAHQRGETNYLPNDTTAEMNLWKQEPALKGIPSPVAAWIAARWTTPAIPGAAPSHLDHYFNQNLNQTLGYLNQPFGAPGAAPAGDPQYPFPWLNWSYRPFNNEYELLLVPTVSSSRLLARNTLDARRYFAYVDGAVRAAGQTQDVYDGATVDQVPYPHLLNFFESGKSSAPPGTAAQFHRLLAYVGVPSRFANAQLQMRADLAGAAGGNHYFHTPFNRISRGREPGRINLNTVTSADVLFGALNMYMSPLQQNSQLNSAFWDKFVRSRRGDGLAATGSALTDMLQINTAMPSRFMRPYRTPGGASLSAPTAGGASTEPPRETEVTLMRADPDVALRPLFELDDTLLGTGGSAVNVTPDQFSMACMDYNRNPYFRYQALQKLGSVFSNHSNVFAVWITVGYFEVTPAPNGVDAGHPDGYTLGAELGSDTGNISRHRAFYIFDRSIPVGFIRGQDINQDKAVLLKRFIE